VRPVAPPPIDREATSAHARSGLTPSETGRPYADLSPTVLAAHGIVHPSSGFSRTREEFRSLKRHVLSKVSRGSNGADSAEQRIILVTSARPGEGKTFTATNLALALAYEKDTRVLLMDADAYRQSLTTYLGISSNTGWLDSMETHGDAETHVIRTNVPDFSVLSTGKERAEIPELMSSRKMKQLLDDLVRSDPGRLVIMDALPCLTSTEPSILAALAGQTLFVVAALETSREDLESSLRLLGASPKVSLVLNKTEPMLTEQFKSYGYAYGYQR
jgi:Mrp family chromosome partitioning ATPase